MKRLLSAVAIFATIRASAQQVNPVPDYVFRNQMSVGRNAVTDTAAYFSIGPRYGANKGFMPPIVGDTATFSSGKRNGLLIFSVQKNKFLYWDSVRVQWSDMAGSSGSYITGKGLTGYVPQFTDTATIDTSALYTLGSQLGVGTKNFTYSSSGRAVMELNGSAGGIYGFKSADTGRGYLLHNGTSMELATTTATGSIFFNTNSATRGSISSAGVWRLHGLAGTGDRVVVASSNGTLSAASSATGLVDTLTISTRAWRQKGLDSLAALEVSGSGTTNYVPKFTASSTIGNSQIFDNGTSVGIGIAAGMSERFNVANSSGNANASISTSSATSGAFLRFGNSVNADGLYVGYNNPAGTLLGSVGGANGGAIVGYGAYPLGFGTNGTERLRITSGGNIGIGINDPESYLTGGRQLVIANTSGAAGTTIRTSNTGDGSIFFSDGTTGDETYRGYVQYIHASDALRFGTSATERMRIFANGRVFVGASPTDAGYQFDVNGTLRSVNGANFATTSGNVGIGTLTPGHLLDVQKNQDAETIARIYNTSTGASANSQIRVENSASRLDMAIRSTGAGTFGALDAGSSYIWYNGTTSLVIGATDASGIIKFNTGGTSERGRINSAGEWIINASGTDAGDYKLQVSGAIYNTGNALLNATSGETWIGGTDYGAYQLSVTNNMYVDGLAVLAGNGAAEVWIGTTSDAGAYRLQVAGDFYNTGSLTTGAPSGGSIKPWKIGEAATVSPTSPNRTLRVEVDGVVYYIHAKTTND